MQEHERGVSAEDYLRELSKREEQVMEGRRRRIGRVMDAFETNKSPSIPAALNQDVEENITPRSLDTE